MTEQIALPASHPRHFDLDCIGPPGLFEGEDAAGYDNLLARIWGALQPRDVFEQIWARDIVDLVWEIFRLLMLCEIERYRTGFGRRLRRAVDEAQDIEDAEFKDVAPAEIEASTRPVPASAPPTALTPAAARA